MSSRKQQCFLIHGADVYRSDRSLQAIRDRFFKQANSMIDCTTYDMEETSLETLKQTFLANPFFVTHRLFILKRTFSSPKSTLDSIVPLLESMGESTVVVFHETKAADKRLSLYSWMAKHGTIMEHATPDSSQLPRWIRDVAAQHGVTLENSAATQIATFFGHNTLHLSLEMAKLAAAARSQGRTVITSQDVAQLCTTTSEESLFGLTDALRQPDLRQAVAQYKLLISQHDPFLLAATIGSQIRSWAKLTLAYEEGITQPGPLASRTKLNPYVVKLSLPIIRQLSPRAIATCYKHIAAFDQQAKDGSITPELGLLLMIIRLHGTVKKEMARY